MTSSDTAEQTTAAPADRLRQAAGVVRVHLADPDLTGGPWISLDGGDRIIRNQPGDEDHSPVYVIDEPTSNAANAAWIALMSPTVGEALAAVFESWAWAIDLDPDVLNRTGGLETVALADQILAAVSS